MYNRNKHLINLYVAVLIIILAATSCVSAKLPVTQIKTGPTQTVDLQVPMPGGTSTGVELNLEFMAGELKLSPGANGYLASGTATYNAVDFEPKIETNGPSQTLRSGVMEIKGLPKFNDDLKNVWDLQLADTPMSLNIKAGAYTGNWELGGLSLENLSISEGGSDLRGAFSKPNNVEMSTFTFSTGGSKTELKGLANANFEQMIFNSGAGDYTLNFDGKLQRDAKVTIETGASSVNIIIPKGVPSQVTFEGGLTGIKMDGDWSQNGNIYTLSGSGPTISIIVKMGVGSLNLKNE